MSGFLLYYPISALINAVTSTILGVIAILRNRRNQINQGFSLFAFSVAFWSYCYFFWQISSEKTTALFWSRTLMVGAIFIPVCYLQFVLALLELFSQRKRIIITGYLLAFVFLILDFSPLFVKDVEPRMVFRFWPIAGIAYAPFLAMFFAYVGYAWYLMFRGLKTFSGIKANQIKYVLLGTAIGFIGGSTNYPLWYNIPVLPVGNSLVAVYVITVAHAIIKYNLMDINVAIKEAIAKGLSFLLISAVACVSSFLALEFAGVTSKIAIIIVSIIAMGIFYSLHSRLQLLISRRLRPRPDFQSILKDYTEIELMAQHTSKGLAELVVNRIADSLKPSVCSLMLLDKSTGLYNIVASSGQDEEIKTIAFKQTNHLISALKNSHNISIIVRDELSKIFLPEQANLIRRDLEILKAQISIPLMLHDELFGLLNLGIKSSGELYTPEEMGFIYIFLTQSAFMMEFLDKIQRIHELEVKEEKLAGMTNILVGFEHEINNQLIPLQTFLMIGVEKLNQYKVDLGDFPRITKEALDTIQMILNSVRDYCDYSEVKEISHSNIQEEIENTLAKLRNRFESINVKITTEISDNLPPIETYRTFPYLFGNLFTNCYYALKERKVRFLDIKAYQTKDPQRPIEIVLKDTGGDLVKMMDRKELSSGGEEAPERSNIGGINFFVAKQIIADHQGELIISTNPPPGPDEPPGTIFTIKLPLTQPKK